MKIKYLFLLFAFVSVAVFSCSKDDDTNPKSDNAKIVGTWNTESVHTVSSWNGESQEETNTYENGDYYKITFNADNTYTSISVFDGQKETESGTYSLSNGKLTVKPDESDNSQKGIPSNIAMNCEINGNKMDLSYTATANLNGQQVKVTVEAHLLKE